MASDNTYYLAVSVGQESRHDLARCPGLDALKAIIHLLAMGEFVCGLEGSDRWQVSILRALGQTSPSISCHTGQLAAWQLTSSEPIGERARI